ALALDRPGAQQHKGREGGVDQHRIYRGGGLQSLVDHPLEQRHAEKGKREQQSGAAPDRGEVRAHARQRKRREGDQGDQPAPEIQRDRLEDIAQRAAEAPVAGREQRREREEEEGGAARSGSAGAHGFNATGRKPKTLPLITKNAIASVRFSPLR